MSRWSPSKTWEKATHAGERARLARQIAAGCFVDSHALTDRDGMKALAAELGARPVPDRNAREDIEYNRAFRWLLHNAEAKPTPPGHIGKLFLKPHVTNFLGLEIRALDDARKARRLMKRRSVKAKPAAESPEAKARAERRKLNGTKRRQDIIAKMSNWERNRWARAGYPAGDRFELIFGAAAIRRLDGTYLNLADGKTYRQSDGAPA